MNFLRNNSSSFYRHSRKVAQSYVCKSAVDSIPTYLSHFDWKEHTSWFLVLCTPIHQMEHTFDRLLFRLLQTWDKPNTLIVIFQTCWLKNIPRITELWGSYLFYCTERKKYIFKFFFNINYLDFAGCIPVKVHQKGVLLGDIWKTFFWKPRRSQ